MKTMTTLHCMSNIRFRPVFTKAFALTGLLAALLAVPAFADNTADVTKLVRSGQYAEALVKADAFLSKNPRDAQMRFLKGVILTEQNKQADAIAIFSRLTEDFPTLPEPYNNLAVLYAANGQYDKARTALDAAIRTNPTYATAYENLGDVHAKLASQAYDKALQLDSGNSAAKSKLTLVRTLVSNMNTGAAPKPAANPTQQDTVVAAAPKAPAPAAAPPASPSSAPAAVVKAEPEPVASAKQPPVKSKPVDSHAEQDEVMSAVNGWAQAWSAQDVKGYLSFYSNDFQPPKGQTRKEWEEDRRSRIEGKGRISVKIESPTVTVDANSATVKFRQIYISDRLTVKGRKTLVLTKRNGGKWQIKQEQSSS